MEGEKYFYSTIEKKEEEPKTYMVSFNEDYFGSENERTGGTLGLVGNLNEWWDKTCLDAGLNPGDRKLEIFGYQLIELGKNALEGAGGGEIKVIFEKNKITASVKDLGPGFNDPNDDIFVNPGHGLSHVKKYSDEFIIETNGKRFTKLKGKNKLIKDEFTDIANGSKVTFIKNFK